MIFGWLAIKGEQKIKTASGDKNAGRGDKMAEAQKRSEMVSRGLEVILKIWRLGGHFCGAHGASAPPPSTYM